MFRINLLTTNEDDEPEMKRSIKNLSDKKFLCKEIEDDTIINEINTSNFTNSNDLVNLTPTDYIDSEKYDNLDNLYNLNTSGSSMVFNYTRAKNLDTKISMKYDKKLIILKSK
ncbi:MAG: hypothetical protein Terrestrivirus4_41 [Terrestrivirus sp.]|uniref:Uncharacterized protein n=1 Tax=Terrestrivirus sp. TaxID=2487775 RepID=A0A3G4ZQV9_9VIRU|nr:MAG: hypothetical protein Terrestrivirus4_41 [Terrestrivirus sp.]